MKSKGSASRRLLRSGAQERAVALLQATIWLRCAARREESFTQLPVQRIEQVIKPTQQQQDVFNKLKAASTEAANQLQASCPTELPQAPIDRFDAVGKRLDVMTAAVKTVRPALADFYSSLTDEQKARFNTLGPPKNTSPRQG